MSIFLQAIFIISIFANIALLYKIEMLLLKYRELKEENKDLMAKSKAAITYIESLPK